MDIKMNVKWKIKVGGKEYGSVDEMPAAEREAYENAIREDAAGGKEFVFTTRDTRVVFNGREYASVDALPPDVRETYLNLVKAVEAGQPPTDEKIVAEAARALARPRTDRSAAPSRGPRPIAPESFSARKLVAWAAVIALLAGLYFLARR